MWRSQSFVEGLDVTGMPQTKDKYWIKLVAAPPTAGSDYGKCIELYERRMPDVFVPGGLPVYVEISQSGADLAWTMDGFKSGLTFIGDLFSLMTLTVFPRHSQSRSRKTVGVYLDERSSDMVYFTAKSYHEDSGSCFPTAFLWPFQDVKDDRFAHGDSSVFGSGTQWRKEYSYLDEEWSCGDADAVVQAIAHAIMKFESKKSVKQRRVMIGE